MNHIHAEVCPGKLGRVSLGANLDAIAVDEQISAIDRDFTIGDRIKGSVFLDVINVYNARNSEGWRYSYNFTDRDRVPGLPILPTIGVRALFE